MPVAFDTHALINRLLQGKMPLEQAEAISAALTEALEDVIGTLATKKDLEALGTDITKDLKHLTTRMTWMISVNWALTLLLVSKLLLFK